MAIVAGLKTYPQTTSWTDEGLLVHKNINLGMAVSLGEDGFDRPLSSKTRIIYLCWQWQEQSTTRRHARSKNYNLMMSKAAHSH